MKKLLISMIFFSLAVAGQTNQGINTLITYEFKHGAKVLRCNHAGVPESDGGYIITERGWDIRVDKVIRDTIVIYFPQWPKEVKNSQALNTKITYQPQKKDSLSLPQRQYYCLLESEFLEHLTPQKSFMEFDVGTATIPIKIRPGGENRPFDFSGNFNVGLGVQVSTKKMVDLYVGLNLTSVSVDSEVTQGFLQIETSAAALTPVIGMIKSIKNFQVGLFVGADYLSRDLAKNWVYQGKPWFGVGIGLGIFKISQSQKEKDQGD